MRVEESDPVLQPDDWATRIYSWLAGAAKLCLWLLLAALVAVNFSAISEGLGGVARRLPEVVKLSVGAVSVEMDSTHVEQSVKESQLSQSDKDNWGAQQSKNAVEGLRGLDKRSLSRLMNVGLLENICRFANPTSDMLFDYAVDQRLTERDLVKTTPDAATLQKVRQFVQDQEKSGKPFQLGHPSECYDLTLTGKGRDVRTWLTQWLASSVETPHAPASPHP